MPHLPIDEVRQLAHECGLEEIYWNEHSKVISFRSLSLSSSSTKRSYEDTSSPSHSHDYPTRYNVYYTTGTVSTSMDHPRQGKTQLFRRNVDLALLQDIFLNPRIHSDLGYKFKNNNKLSCSSKRVKGGILRNLRYTSDDKNNDDDDDDDDHNDAAEGEEDAAKRQMVKLVAERKAIDTEIKEIQAILDEHERLREVKRQKEREEKERQRREEEAAEEAARKAAEEARKAAEAARRKALQTARGKFGTWRGLRESNDFRSNFTNDSTCIAIGGNTHLILYENGSWAYSSGLIDGVHQKLKTRALSHPSPKYIAMSADNVRYYIRFANGKSEWVGPDSMTELLQGTSREVRSVAFGQNYQDYFVVFEDGGWQYSGVPDGLVSKLNARQKRGDLERVSLGPNGEWFLSAKNGRAWWGNCSDLFYKDVKEVMDEAGDIVDIQFGETGTWFIRYK